jgi:hypothetical protein
MGTGFQTGMNWPVEPVPVAQPVGTQLAERLVASPAELALAQWSVGQPSSGGHRRWTRTPRGM